MTAFLAAAWWVKALGYGGQVFFFLRMVLQWLQSEKAKKTVVPVYFWHLSLAGALMVVSYNAILKEPVFVLGGVAQIFIYARNLFIRKQAGHGQLLPVALGIAVFFLWYALEKPRPPDVGFFWIAIGFTGASLWLLRFVLQWYISERRGISVLPDSFWIVSLCGCGFQLAYAIRTMNGPMIAGFAVAWVPYMRNLALNRRARKTAEREPAKREGE